MRCSLGLANFTKRTSRTLDSRPYLPVVAHTKRCVPFQTTNVRNFGQKSALLQHSRTAKPLVTRYNEIFSQHKQIISFDEGEFPHIHRSAFIAPDAVIAGRVMILAKSSIWYHCVIRAEINKVEIGAVTNVQEGCVITEAFGPLDRDHDGRTVIGSYVTIGPNCSLRACTVENECKIGSKCVLQEGSYMEENSVLGDNSVLVRGARIPSGQLWQGNPAAFVKNLSESEIGSFKEEAERMFKMADVHKLEFDLHSDAYREAEALGLKIGWEDPNWWKND